MDSPLLLLIFPALLLAYPLYAILRDEKRAKLALERIVTAGFVPTRQYQLTDLIIAIDEPNRKIALVDFDLYIIPRGMDPPVDRDAFSVRKTEVVSLDEIDHLKVHFQSTGYIDCVLVYKEPNHIDSTLRLPIPLHSGDRSTLETMLAAWPTRTLVTRDAK
jgi:hypothetical protein